MNRIRLFRFAPLMLSMALAGHALGDETRIVSSNNSGTIGDDQSSPYGISADGRFVALNSRADNLDGTIKGAGQVLLKDLADGSIRMVSLRHDGSVPFGSSLDGSISDDGTYIVFRSSDNQIVPNGPLSWNVYLRDLQTGENTLVSASNTGEHANGFNSPGVISGDGRYVVFYSMADNLLPGDTNGQRDVFVYDRVQGKLVQRIGGNGDTVFEDVSSDGRFIVISSAASDLVPSDTNNAYDTFIYDRETGRMELISVANDGSQGNAQSMLGRVSDNGRFVTFSSVANNLVPGDTNGQADVFLYDRDSGTMRLVSHANDGTQGNGFSAYSVISGNGRFIAYVSHATNLIPGDTNGKADVFVYDRVTEQTEIVSVSTTGALGNSDTAGVILINYDGTVISFASAASNLVPGDTNGVMDAFVRLRDIPNQKPVAKAGDGQSKECSAGVASFVLNASGSYDLDGDNLTYTWSGPFGTLTGETVTVTLGVGQHAIALSVSDGNGGTASDSMVLNVTDTQTPLVDAGPDVNLEAISVDGAPFTVSYSASDSCSSVSVSVAPTPQYYPLGTTQVSVTATDTSGNSASDAMRVNVADTTPPVITPPANVVAEATGFATTVAIGSATASDIFPVTVTHNAPSAFVLGATPVTWTATDSNGNSAQATQSVTVRDTTPPALLAPADVSFEATGPFTRVAIGTATATDAFDVTISNNAPETFPLGNTVVTWTAADANGNSANATQNIMGADTTAPYLTVPGPVTVEATGAMTNVDIGTATAIDAFDVTITNDAPSRFPVGETLVTWTATDANGNVATGTQSVSVTDTTAPSIQVPADISVEATAVETPVDLGSASATDLVDTLVTVQNDAPAAFGLGTTVVTWTATDASGNTATATQRVTVTDTTPPVVSVPADLRVEATGPAMAIDIGSAVANDIFAVTLTHDAPTAFGLGTTVVTWTATDANGNTATALQNVTVADTTPPQVNAGDDVVLEATSIQGASFSLTYHVSDICDCGPISMEISPRLDVYPLGATTVTITATDSSGNRASDSRTVTVVDTTPPVLTLPADINLEATGPQTTVDIGMAQAFDIFPVSVVNDAPATFGLGTTVIAWTATDANGNVSHGTQKVTVVDTTPAVFKLEILEEKLWPPRFDMVLAAKVSNIEDLVDAAPTVDITVTTNGNHPRKPKLADWKVVQDGDEWQIWLRAERLVDPRTERVYDIAVWVTDASGNVAEDEGQVVVPDNMGKRGKHREDRHEHRDRDSGHDHKGGHKRHDHDHGKEHGKEHKEHKKH